jgi:hypothetical protein
MCSNKHYFVNVKRSASSFKRLPYPGPFCHTVAKTIIIMEITGLDEFQRELSNLQHAIESLDGTLATLNFDAADPDSVNEAIRKMEAALDSKAAPYRGNATITSLIEEMKEKFRQEILERAKAEQK